ncbi:unnamed protein product [Rotaria sordida]|uniref:PAN2-PAN3 deadenylation complex catalytic subunit PAN2 N-terminal domain-containing protein n=1 Tax=Rotaria sordida TaxID=392033 RepID=A0A819DPE0_9BILA|nr:unnamed protein product [Rotaria sordida]CAF1350057.1 unnamed protein product [Rotaria sordida]CAF1378240.1 unnamed protein product [Rotaria sordida]CAF1421360.1 unnamed protein product [Rotaria sordida]CAF1601275.1 unnamed protein product [Rotaria sordida]
MDGTNDAPYALDYSESMAFFNSAYNPTSAQSITATEFDIAQELLWAGSNEGRVASFYGCELRKYTGFRVSTTSDIRSILSITEGPLILTSDSLSLYTRQGLNIFHHRAPYLDNMQCMLMPQSHKQKKIYIGGYGGQLCEMDFDKKTLLRQVSLDEGDCIILKYCTRNFIATGSTNGVVNLRDPNSLQVIQRFTPHHGSLSDLDINNMYLVTCGFTRKMDHMNLDRFLVVYDLRNMQQLAPVPVFIDPCFLHYHTMTSTSVMVASQQGHHTQVDLTGGLTQTYSPIINLTTNPAGIITTFSVSTSMHCTAFGHSTGTIHLLYKNDPQCCFNYQSVETQFANPPMDPKVGDLNNSISSLSSVPIPITPLKLLSDMPKQWTKSIARPTPKIPNEFLDNVRVFQGLACVKNPSTRRANQWPYPPDSDTLAPREQIKFLPDEDDDTNINNKNIQEGTLNDIEIPNLNFDTLSIGQQHQDTIIASSTT